MIHKNHILLLVLIFAFSCGKKNAEEKSVTKDTLFQKLEPSETGIDFTNVMIESDSVNVTTYQYIYNGSGVAVGDINNDGLQDLFFTSNQGDCKLYLNKGDFKFEDITKSAGIKTSHFCTGTVMADVNNDGFIDIYVSRSNPFFSDENRENLLFINQGDNTFVEMGKEYGVNDAGYTSNATFFDFDNDGDLDLFVGNHPIDFDSDIRKRSCYEEFTPLESDHLYENLGNGTFKKVTKHAGISSYAFCLGIAISDFDGDGRPDIYVANDYYGPDFLYINQGNGTFKERHQDFFKRTSTNAMGCDAADFNNDGLVDFMVVDMLPNDNYRRKLLSGPSNFDYYILRWNSGYGHQSMKNSLQMNRGNGKFSEIAAFSGVEATDWSWAPLFADFDNDGWKDIYLTNGYYRDVTNLDFVAYEANFLKQKNRGMTVKELADVLPNKKTRNYAFSNNKDWTFTDVSKEWGLDYETVSMGAAYVDLNNDGNLDLIACNMNHETHIYRNNSKAKNNFIQCEFKGKEVNKFGLGAKVIIHTSEGIQMAENFVTRGYNSSVAPIVHFGLGNQKVEKLEVFWPNGKYQVLSNPNINEKIVLSEKNATENWPSKKEESIQYFVDKTSSIQSEIKHKESGFIDFKREPLLPRMFSKRGPDVAVADVNGDGLEDFFISGSSISAPELFIQQRNGQFLMQKGPWSENDGSEQTVVKFFDFNKDGYPDLYVGNGSNEYDDLNDIRYQDKLYINNNGTFSLAQNVLPDMRINTGAVAIGDINGDGFPDLFIGGNVKPGYYPLASRSYVLINENGKFRDATESLIPEMLNGPLINDAHWVDLNKNGTLELVVAGEWMPISIYQFDDNQWKNETDKFGLGKYLGWWKTLAFADLDNDGNLDIVAGNEGMNSQYRASPLKPIYIDYGDLDGNGSFEGMVSQYYLDVLAPIYSKEDLLSRMIAFMNKNYKYYETYARTNTSDLLTKTHKVDGRLEVNELRSKVFLQKNGKFNPKPLPNSVQISPLFNFYPMDVDNDGNMDLVVVGNSFDNKIELGWVDALNGSVLLGDGKGNFTEKENCGFFVPGNPKYIKKITIKNEPYLLVSNNNDQVQFFKILR
jgi:hypothetical protein